MVSRRRRIPGVMAQAIGETVRGVNGVDGVAGMAVEEEAVEGAGDDNKEKEGEGLEEVVEQR